MGTPLDAMLNDPWRTLRLALDGPLHPGGVAATGALLDRAGVGEGTRLLDVGCGAGEALDVARERGADPLGVDRDPRTAGAVRGDMTDLPVRTASVDVVLAECVLCLAPSLPRALAETERVLAPGGRLALSDVVVDGDLPDLPDAIARTLCLTGSRDRGTVLGHVEDAGFAVGEVRDHREDLLAMRDRATERVDYRGLLGALGDRGRRLREGVETLEAAVESGRVSYVSLVATAEP